jgi:hypothetical protein
MKRVMRIVLIAIVAALVVIQFIRPEKNQGEIDPQLDLIQVAGMPDSLALIIKNSCYDCHSNHTRYPWYNQVAPVSWMMAKHVRNWTDELNMSTFGELEKNRKIRVLSEICEEVEGGSMPLKSYRFIHRDAVLSEEEVEALCEWTDLAALRIMRE